jgi:hypothetical protein
MCFHIPQDLASFCFHNKVKVSFQAFKKVLVQILDESF